MPPLPSPSQEEAVCPLDHSPGPVHPGTVLEGGQFPVTHCSFTFKGRATQLHHLFSYLTSGPWHPLPQFLPPSWKALPLPPTSTA